MYTFIDEPKVSLSALGRVGRISVGFKIPRIGSFTTME